MQTARPKVNSGLAPPKGAGWTPQQYALAMRSILAAPANAVPIAMLEAAFGGGTAGREVVQAMVRANLLAYRPRSAWARDISKAVFQGDRAVVAAPTPAHLACMEELELPQPAPVGMVSCASACFAVQTSSTFCQAVHAR